MRKGVHTETYRQTDLGGYNALLSNHFYYFGEGSRPIADDLKEIIKRGRGIAFGDPVLKGPANQRHPAPSESVF